MSTHTLTPYRSAALAGHDGFAQLLRAEWTKFRTVRGWVRTDRTSRWTSVTAFAS
jgi:hypothetical protein